MDKRYQVFVSSTYKDLQEERQEIMHALLELDCIPSGMELFPAANEDQWTLIQGVIDDCDYYLVILGGRYGSVGTDGLSYTEKEYRYAVEKGKPVMAFLHKEPGELPANRTEQDPNLREKLKEFRSLVQQRMCKYWTSPADLGSVVSRSLVRMIKTHPSVGWIRGDRVSDATAATELLKLRNRIEQLETQLAEVSHQAPPGSEFFAQGDEVQTFSFSYMMAPSHRHLRFGEKITDNISLSWNEVFSSVAPILIHEASEEIFKEKLDKLIEKKIEEKNNSHKSKEFDVGIYKLDSDDFQTIKIQLIALGLITKSVKNRSIKDISTYWTLTPYGDTHMMKLRAIRRDLLTESV
jgi:hypothetical protein